MDELTYTWEITSIKKMNDPSIEVNDIIVQTYWKCTGIDNEGHVGIFNGATPFEPDKVDVGNFTTYENLTEEQIIGWVKAEIERQGDSYWNHITSQIKKQINQSKQTINEVTTSELPWNKGVK